MEINLNGGGYVYSGIFGVETMVSPSTTVLIKMEVRKEELFLIMYLTTAVYQTILKGRRDKENLRHWRLKYALSKQLLI